MNVFKQLMKFWRFLKKDTWQSWLVSLILIVVFIKFIFFPVLSLVTGAALPLVVVESCSMYHESRFDSWWESNAAWYELREIDKEDFEGFPFRGGLNKGDIIFVIGRGGYDVGDIIIFQAGQQNPIIHRIVTESPISTKGDHNSDQSVFENDISESRILGKSVVRIPLVGWLKLIFFEPLREKKDRGFCR
jgi:signal peptidase I